MSNESGSAKMLRDFLDQVFNMEVEKAEIAADIAELYATAKARGFSVSAMKKVVKRRLETEEARRAREEVEAVAELYEASAGLLGRRPLGDAARERMNRMQSADNDQVNRHADDDDDPDLIKPADPDHPDQPELVEETPQETVEEARQRGRDDALAGRKVLENPYVAGDPRRAAWDEGWCESAGSDGMDIPDAWRPSKKPKKAAEPDPEAGSDPDAPAQDGDGEQEG